MMGGWWEEMASKHPWWKEFTEYNEVYVEKIKRARERGANDEDIYEYYRGMTVEEEIELAKLIHGQRDVYYYFEELAERQKANSDGIEEFHPAYGDVVPVFIDLYWFRQGLPSQPGWVYHASTGLVLAYAMGEVSELDGPEAYKVLDKKRLKNQIRRFKLGWEINDA